MSKEPVVSYSSPKQKFRVYRDSGVRLEYIDAVDALNAPEAARVVVKKHHDWRTDGPEWSVVVVPASALTSVTVTFEPQVVTSGR